MEEHFAKVMGGDGGGWETSGCQIGRGRLDQSSISGCVNQSLGRRYVLWVLNEVKKDAAPGLDGECSDRNDVLQVSRLYGCQYLPSLVNKTWFNLKHVLCSVRFSILTYLLPLTQALPQTYSIAPSANTLDCLHRCSGIHIQGLISYSSESSMTTQTQLVVYLLPLLLTY